ncbi:hypothetical protein HBI26_160730 [Parastagonospora nodorum]|nr:hypothetical protein HBI10_066390 [Parastagonospora nodorum]KAH4028183.1 hypothetical protein HBI13_051620 [Parastagonospora nodorum]KAH4330804.1 hypothetical protein HBI00_081370 [Parastagonospora nodorum]KAH4386094.1 hypothetical protein HBH99_172220 [Parastagonospora nodorum]KAH5051700.1 hypothetical protein HBH96_168630 [Parastagonospora nodorum]
MAHLSTIFNHAFCVALGPLYSCKSTIVARPSKSKAQYIRLRKHSAAPEAVYQLVERAEDHHGRKLELYKRMHNTALDQGDEELKEHIAVTQRKHRKQNYDMDEEGAMIEQAVKETKGQIKQRRESTKAVSNDRTVTTSTRTETRRHCRVDSVAPTTVDEDRSALTARVESLWRHLEPTSRTVERSTHSTSPHHPASELANGNASFVDSDPMSPQSPLLGDTLPQCTIKTTNTKHAEKCVERREASHGECAQETWTSPFRQPQMGIPQSKHLVSGAEYITTSRSDILDGLEAV